MSVLTTIKRVANNGLQAELLDTVVKTGAINVLAMLNKGDERFNVGSVRRAWFPVTIEALKDMGVTGGHILSIEALQHTESYELNLENPTIDGLALKVQVVESIEPDVYQRQNIMKTAKQIMITEEIAAKGKIKTDYDLKGYVNKNGYFLNVDGNFIFNKTTVSVEGQVKHQFIDGILVPETELANFGATLASNVNVQVGQES